MKKLFVIVTVICLLLSSCNSSVSDGGELTTPSDTITPEITTSADTATTAADTTATDTTAADTTVAEAEPEALSVYDTLNEFFKYYTPIKVGTMVITNAHDLLDVYRYIMSEDARHWICLRYEFVEGSAYNDYLNNTYTPDFFGYGIEGGENYLVAVMIRTPSSSGRVSLTVTVDSETVHVDITNAPPYHIPYEDGGFFIYLLPVEGKYEGQELTFEWVRDS